MSEKVVRFPQRVVVTPGVQVDTGPAVIVTGGSGGGDGMEARIAKLESDVEYIKRDIGELKIDVREMRNDLRTDFRILFGALITAVIGLTAVLAHGFKWL